jgi:hypothetical protein
MSKKILSIVLGVALIACFFLAYTSFMGVDFSMYDMVFKSPGGDWQKYIPLIFPISGLMLLIGAANKDQYFLGRGLWAWLPFLAVLYLLIGMPLMNHVSFGDIMSSLGKGYGIGLWGTIASAVILVISTFM